MYVQKVPTLVPMAFNGMLLIADVTTMMVYSCLRLIAIRLGEFCAPHLYQGVRGGIRFWAGNVDEFELFGTLCSQKDFVNLVARPMQRLKFAKSIHLKVSLPMIMDPFMGVPYLISLKPSLGLVRMPFHDEANQLIYFLPANFISHRFIREWQTIMTAKDQDENPRRGHVLWATLDAMQNADFCSSSPMSPKSEQNQKLSGVAKYFDSDALESTLGCSGDSTQNVARSSFEATRDLLHRAREHLYFLVCSQASSLEALYNPSTVFESPINDFDYVSKHQRLQVIERRDRPLNMRMQRFSSPRDAERIRQSHQCVRNQLAWAKRNEPSSSPQRCSSSFLLRFDYEQRAKKDSSVRGGASSEGDGSVSESRILAEESSTAAEREKGSSSRKAESLKEKADVAVDCRDSSRPAKREDCANSDGLPAREAKRQKTEESAVTKSRRVCESSELRSGVQKDEA